MTFPTDIRILEIEPFFSDERPRALLKFGNAVADGITFCHVRARVENRRGHVADGWGAILLSHFWAFHTPTLDAATKDRAMRRTVEALCRRFADSSGYAHPIDLFMTLETELQSIAEQTCAAMGLPESLPLLGTLVCGSPIDAALHDAFGVTNGLSSWNGYTRDFMAHDLSAWLGPAFAGRYPGAELRPAFAPSLPVFHVVGGLDRIRRSDVPPDTPDNGLPRSLEEWIEQDGVYCLKLKPRGNDMTWDVQTTLDVYAIARQTLVERGQRDLYLTLDPNEQCDSPAYMVELLRRVRHLNPAAYDSILYIEQPVERDLSRQRHDMRELSALKPVLIDESLMTFEDFDLALELGWSGVALKTCKCHTLTLLMAARAHAQNIPYGIQDLTNPGIALLHSVGMAARLRPILGVETNARQYYPDSSEPESKVHPGITRARSGRISTASLYGPGLGYRTGEIGRDLFRSRL